jgi:hypothetical protein
MLSHISASLQTNCAGRARKVQDAESTEALGCGRGNVDVILFPLVKNKLLLITQIIVTIFSN